MVLWLGDKNNERFAEANAFHTSKVQQRQKGIRPKKFTSEAVRFFELIVGISTVSID